MGDNKTIQVFQRASQLQELGRHKDAMSLYQDLIQDEHHASRAWEEMAHCYIHLDDYSMAETAVLNAIELEPEFLNYRSILAYIKLAQGKTRRSRILLQKILSEDPTHYQSRYLLAQVYLSTENLSEVQKLIHSLENDWPDNPDLKTLKIRYHALKNDKVSFNHEVNAKLNDNPEDIYALSLKGYAYLEAQEFDIAEELAIQVLAIDPMNESAKEVLLICRQNSNILLRFFVGKSFGLYKMEWTFSRVIIAIICFKGVLLWGGFFIIYMLITWVGGVLYNSYLRINLRDRLLLTTRQINQSNFLLLILGLLVFFRIISRFSENIMFDKLSIYLIPALFIGVSYFQLTSKNKKIYFGISTLVLSSLLYLGFGGTNLFAPILAATFVVILHGILFTFRAIGE